MRTDFNIMDLPERERAGRLLAFARRDKRLEPVTLAGELGVSVDQYNRWESGDDRIPPHHLPHLCERLGFNRNHDSDLIYHVVTELDPDNLIRVAPEKRPGLMVRKFMEINQVSPETLARRLSMTGEQVDDLLEGRTSMEPVHERVAEVVGLRSWQAELFGRYCKPQNIIGYRPLQPVELVEPVVDTGGDAGRSHTDHQPSLNGHAAKKPGRLQPGDEKLMGGDLLQVLRERMGVDAAELQLDLEAERKGARRLKIDMPRPDVAAWEAGGKGLDKMWAGVLTKRLVDPQDDKRARAQLQTSRPVEKDTGGFAGVVGKRSKRDAVSMEEKQIEGVPGDLMRLPEHERAGQWIKQLRKEKKMNQKELAQALEQDLTRRSEDTNVITTLNNVMVCNWEKGHASIHEKWAPSLVAVLDAPQALGELVKDNRAAFARAKAQRGSVPDRND